MKVVYRFLLFVCLFVYKSFVLNSKYSSLSANMIGIPAKREKAYLTQRTLVMGFPGGTMVKNPPANAGDTGSSPGWGRSHMLWSN